MFGSIYGPGVLNDTIVPGYGVTKFPVDLNTFWQLPNGTTRNFALETQYTTYPMGYPSIMYQLANGFTSQNHISNWNPMLIGMDLTGGNTTNPFLTQQAQVDAFNWGANMVAQVQLQRAVQNIASALGSMESGLTNALKSDKLTNAQKAELEGLLEEVKSLKEKIEKQLKDKNPSKEEIEAMQKEVIDLQKKVSDSADKIRAELKEDEAADSSDTSVTSDSSTVSDDVEDMSDTKYKDIDPKTGRPKSLGDVPKMGDCREFCSKIFDAIDGFCTKNDVIETTIPGLNEKNIVEVIACWEKYYGNGDQGLIRRLLDDLGHGQKKKFVPMLLNALITRAEALGIENEIKQYVVNVNKELSDYNISDTICSNNLMKIYDKIVAKEKENREGVDKTVADRKTENANKIKEHKEQVIIQEKKDELANRMKDALKLSEIPQLAFGLKVETDDNGEFTGYSIEIETPNSNGKKVKITGTPYQQLAKAIENNGLKVEDVLIRQEQA